MLFPLYNIFIACNAYRNYLKTESLYRHFVVFPDSSSSSSSESSEDENEPEKKDEEKVVQEGEVAGIIVPSEETSPENETAPDTVDKVITTIMLSKIKTACRRIMIPFKCESDFAAINNWRH